MKRVAKIIAWFLVGWGSFGAFAAAQDVERGRGVIRIIDWPGIENLAEDDPLFDPEAGFVPVIRVLTLGYAYNVIEDRPYLSMALEWEQGDEGILDGEVVARDRLPDSIRIATIELMAGVVVERDSVAALHVVLDSLYLAPHPDLYQFELFPASLGEVFVDTPADSARRYLESELQLEDLRILSVTFEGQEQAPQTARERSGRGRRRPARSTVYRPNIGIYVEGIIVTHTRPPAGQPRPVIGTGTPRGERVGRGEAGGDDQAPGRAPETRTGRTRDAGEGVPDRTTRRDGAERSGDDPDTSGDTTSEGDDTGRSRRSGRSRDDDDDDDDDDESLLPVAIAGAAAIAAVAVTGGTVGVFSSPRHAPIGVMGGYVQPRGGILFQVAINEAVLQRSTDTSEHFMARLFGFYDLLKNPIQPAAGGGLYVREDGGDFSYEPSVWLGAAGNFGPVLVVGGVDVTGNGFDVGIGYNFRYRRSR